MGIRGTDPLPGIMHIQLSFYLVFKPALNSSCKIQSVKFNVPTNKMHRVNFGLGSGRTNYLKLIKNHIADRETYSIFPTWITIQ